jgi:hypothetical protein
MVSARVGTAWPTRTSPRPSGRRLWLSRSRKRRKWRRRLHWRRRYSPTYHLAPRHLLPPPRPTLPPPSPLPPRRPSLPRSLDRHQPSSPHPRFTTLARRTSRTRGRARLCPPSPPFPLSPLHPHPRHPRHSRALSSLLRRMLGHGLTARAGRLHTLRLRRKSSRIINSTMPRTSPPLRSGIARSRWASTACGSATRADTSNRLRTRCSV